MLARQALDDLGRGALAEQDDARADGEREHEVRAGRVAEEELGHAERDVASAHAEHALPVALGVVGEVVLQMHCSLRLARRARGKQPDRVVVTAGGEALEARCRRQHDLAPALGLLRRAGVLAPDDGVLEQGRTIELRLRLVRDVGVADEDPRARVLEVVRVVVGGQLGVDHGDDGADFEHAEEGRGELERVVQANQHAVFRTYAAGDERVRDLVRQRLQPFVARRAAIVGDARLCAETLGGCGGREKYFSARLKRSGKSSAAASASSMGGAKAVMRKSAPSVGARVYARPLASSASFLPRRAPCGPTACT